jgi:hypothetical protein
MSQTSASCVHVAAAERITTMPKSKTLKTLKKPKPLKPLKLGGQLKGLVKSGRISPKALKSVRGAQIAVRKPRGGVGKGMAGM